MNTARIHPRPLPIPCESCNGWHETLTQIIECQAREIRKLRAAERERLRREGL